VQSGRHHCRQCGASCCSTHFHRPHCARCSKLRPILQELWHTEKSYVDDLEALVAVERSLREESLLPAATLQALFSNVGVLRQLNGEFLSRLATQTSGAELLPTVELVAAAFTALTPFFRLCALAAARANRGSPSPTR
jgi:hypothetical protein